MNELLKNWSSYWMRMGYWIEFNKTMENTSAINHLETIQQDIQRMIDQKEDFVAFVLISLGIEFLGSFYDDKDFADYGQSKIRFENALSNLFKNNWYKNQKQWIFENLRGPLIHQYRAGNGILLSSNCKNQAPLAEHLIKKEGKVLFVLEAFFNDFKAACAKFKNEIVKASNSLNREKLSQDYAQIALIRHENKDSNFSVSGQPSTVLSESTIVDSSSRKERRKLRKQEPKKKK